MAGLRFLIGVSEIAGAYDAMACDAWGVIHNGRTLLPGAADAMIRFREERGPLVIVTNAPKPSAVIPPQLDRLGLPRDAYDSIVSSGDATRDEIVQRLPAPAFRIGPSFDDALFEGLQIDFVPLSEAAFIICTGLVDDLGEAPEDYRSLLTAAAEKGLDMICANPDIMVNWGGEMRWCAGALAEIYEELGGAVVYGGKPYPPIYRLVRAAMDEARGDASAPARPLAVGDGLKTDILGANRAGFDAVLVAGDGGLHDGAADRASIAARVREAGVSVVGVLEGLTW